MNCLDGSIVRVDHKDAICSSLINHTSSSDMLMREFANVDWCMIFFRECSKISSMDYIQSSIPNVDRKVSRHQS